MRRRLLRCAREAAGGGATSKQRQLSGCHRRLQVAPGQPTDVALQGEPASIAHVAHRRPRLLVAEGAEGSVHRRRRRAAHADVDGSIDAAPRRQQRDEDEERLRDLRAHLLVVGADGEKRNVAPRPRLAAPEEDGAGELNAVVEEADQVLGARGHRLVEEAHAGSTVVRVELLEQLADVSIDHPDQRARALQLEAQLRRLARHHLRARRSALRLVL